MSPARIGLYSTAAFAVSFCIAATHAAGDGAPTLERIGSWLGLAATSEDEAPAITADSDVAHLPPADPFALAQSIVDARQAFADTGDDIALTAARAEYVGREIVWEVRYVAPFCTAPDRCAVLPFDHARLDDDFLQGWMPRLELSPEGHRLLTSTCAAHERCVLTLRAEISELELSPGLPTSIALGEVRVESARSVAAHESWMRRRRNG